MRQSSRMSQPATSRDLKEPYQCASRVLVVRPGSFGRNEAAAASNAFMHATDADVSDVADLARRETDALAGALIAAGVEVLIDDEPDLPDSVFPNNWMSYHQPAASPPVLITYPMATALRRLERRESTIARIAALSDGILVRINLEHLESRNEIVEGTGALVLDRVAGVAFACRSSRATDGALDAWSHATGYEVVRFDAIDASGTPVYHTNVLMSIGAELAVFAPETVPSPAERRTVLDRLEALNKQVLDITLAQMGEMCANVLELRTTSSEPVMAMSERARQGFTPAQRKSIERVAAIVAPPIPTIETIGGGSVRCMIAELGGSSP